jgi:hypothetical protein
MAWVGRRLPHQSHHRFQTVKQNALAGPRHVRKETLMKTSENSKSPRIALMRKIKGLAQRQETFNQ